LVYAAFPSPSLVPRDVVFGRFASVGGVKDSWNVPLFIRTAEFAEELPADEDPMPPDGNPHPLPGNLHPMDNMFIPPQYPELGWNMVPMEQGPMGQDPMGHNDHHLGHNDMLQQDMQDEEDQQQQQEENQEEDDQEAESMVLVPSDVSGDSVNMGQENQVVVQFMQHLDCPVMTHQVVFGPIIPPAMQWERLFEHMVPKLLSASVPLAFQLSPFTQLKRSWDSAFFAKEGDWFLSKGSCFPEFHRPKFSPRRIAVVRKDLLEEKKDHTEVLFEATPLVIKKQRARKVITPLVQSNERRFTKSCLRDGYRPAPVIEAPPKKKAKGRAKLLVVQDGQQEDSSTPCPENNTNDESEEGFIRTPATPIHVLQRIGRQLGIPEEKLTKEKLVAAPKKTTKDKSDNV
jgi:hypothetical protein